jgi:hypothetical protein
MGGGAAAAAPAAGLPPECTGCFSPVLTPAAVLKAHAHHLTAHEQAEVLDYPQVVVARCARRQAVDRSALPPQRGASAGSHALCTAGRVSHEGEASH